MLEPEPTKPQPIFDPILRWTYIGGAIAFIAIICTLVWLLSRQLGAEFSSPQNPKFRVLFIEDETLGFYAVSGRKRPEHIATIGWNEERHFARGQWTTDGQMFVCTVTDAYNPYCAVGYDFASAEKIVPEWLNYSAKADPAKVEKFISELQSRIAFHGGLRSEIVNRAKIDSSLQARVWHAPPD